MLAALLDGNARHRAGRAQHLPDVVDEGLVRVPLAGREAMASLVRPSTWMA